jgi:hypothetical protein
VRKAQERKIWREGLNRYINKFRVPNAKHHKYEIGSRKKIVQKKLFRIKILETLRDDFSLFLSILF